MIKQLAGIASKGFTNNQGKTIYDTNFNFSGFEDKKNSSEASPTEKTNSDKNTNQKNIKITPTINWEELKQKITNNKNKITLNLGKPSNDIVQVLVDINSFSSGEKTKTFNVSISPEFDRSFSIIKYLNPKNNKQQDLIIPKNEQKANKNLKFANIGYNTFYENIIV